MKTAPRPAIIVDLDGTMLACNSWPVFARAVLRQLMSTRRRATALALAALLTARKLRLISHSAVKYRFARCSQSFPDSFHDRLVGQLEGEVNTRVRHLVDSYVKQGYVPVLATAAAGEYAVPLGRRLGFAHITSTPRAGGGSREYQECVGERKADMVSRLMQEAGLTPAAVVTDHWHDLPLLRRFSSCRRYLVAPGRETLARIGDTDGITII